MKRRTASTGLACLAWALVGMAWNSSALGIGVDQIPSPRPAGWTVDLTGRISSDTVKALDRLGDEVRKQTGAELAVVVIGSTDGADPHQFATNLFNRWQIGQADKNNGLLIFVALDDRKAEIILGDGIDDATRVQASRTIMQETILPKLRQGDPGGAVFRGARACAEQILGAKLEPLQAEAADAGDANAKQAVAVPAKVQAPPPVQQAPPIRERAFAPPQQRPRSHIVSWFFGGIGFLGVLIFGTRKLLRYHPRRCKSCGGSMTLLGELADNEYLTPGEKTEERLGSVDYDVWACGTCGKTLKYRYGAMFTRYSRCPQCRAKTKSTTKRTVRAATYVQGGLVDVESHCRNCSFRSSHTHSTPPITDATAASTAMWSASPGACSPTISSPTTSFDAGFSGGHSSGGGASGSW